MHLLKTKRMIHIKESNHDRALEMIASKFLEDHKIINEIFALKFKGLSEVEIGLARCFSYK